MNASDIDSYVEQQIETYADDPKFRAEGMALGVAEEIALLLSAVGINQTQFARALGVSRQLVSKWERGVSQPIPRQVAQAQAYLESLLQQRLVEVLDAAEKRYR